MVEKKHLWLYIINEEATTRVILANLLLTISLFYFGLTKSSFVSFLDGKTLKGWQASPGVKCEVKMGCY